MALYGYCRVSRPKQNIERQVRNITHAYPDAVILREVFTRTRMAGRTEWAKLMRVIKPGDMIIFDSVSRLSGDAAEGVATYMDLYEKGVELVFLNEPHINTSVYRNASSPENQVPMTGSDVDIILSAVNEYMKRLAAAQIRLAFEQSEKEVEDLRSRTRGGIETARLNGKQIGRPAGRKYETKKARECKALMLEMAKDFNGNMTDVQVRALLRIHQDTYYKYKKELWAQIEEGNIKLKNKGDEHGRNETEHLLVRTKYK